MASNAQMEAELEIAQMQAIDEYEDRKRAEQEIERLRSWVAKAQQTLEFGVYLMPDAELRRWSGVRAVIESCPLDDEQIAAVAR